MYYAKVFQKDVGRGLDILSDILMNSRMDDAAIRRERDVIIREMEEVNKQQEEVREPVAYGRREWRGVFQARKLQELVCKSRLL